MEAEFPVDSVENEYEVNSPPKGHSGQRCTDVPTSLKLPASTRCMTIIPELRWKIFQLVHDSMGNRALLALALTCKSFSGPALDLLWQDLNGFLPLIKCLPQSLWKQEGPRLVFQRTMTFDDWSIFCKYNHRVRSLGAYPGANTEILRNLSCPPFPLPLLPNLISLMWKSTNTEMFSYIWLFVTPKLRKLEIITTAFGPSEHSVLSLISMLCPSVSHFNFCSFRDSADTSTALQCWSHLTSVTTRTISEAAILHLLKLPSLRVLGFHLPPTRMFVNTKRLLQHSTLCAVQDLAVVCSSLVLVDALFEGLSIAPKSLSLDILDGVDSAHALPISLSRVSDTCAHNSLLQMQLTIRDLPTDHKTSIGLAVFKPLFAFHNLRRLNIEVDQRYYVMRWDDYVLLQMAQAWPLLEELHLNKFGHSNHGVTPNAFVSLLQHCPRLVSVTVIINWSTIDGHDISPDVPYQGFAHKALSYASFGSPRIRHPTRIAAFISAVAPKVVQVCTWIGGFRRHINCDKYSARWTVVEDLLKTFSVVREQGRRSMLITGEGVDDHRIEGSHNHIGIAHPVQESENGDAIIGGGGEVYDVTGSESDEEYVSSDEEEGF